VIGSFWIISHAKLPHLNSELLLERRTVMLFTFLIFTWVRIKSINFLSKFFKIIIFSGVATTDIVEVCGSCLMARVGTCADISRIWDLVRIRKCLNMIADQAIYKKRQNSILLIAICSKLSNHHSLFPVSVNANGKSLNAYILFSTLTSSTTSKQELDFCQNSESLVFIL